MLVKFLQNKGFVKPGEILELPQTVAEAYLAKGIVEPMAIQPKPELAKFESKNTKSIKGDE